MSKPRHNPLLERCQMMLAENGIAPFTDRSLYWTVSGELGQEYLDPIREENVRLLIFGYPVEVEWLVGEQTVMLQENIAVGFVPLPVPTA